jgi:amidase
LFLRFRDLFERFDLLLTPASPVKQFPVDQNFPAEINGKKLENYTDWIAGSFFITLMSLPAGSVPAGKTRDGLPRILSLAKLIQRLHPIAGGHPTNERSPLIGLGAGRSFARPASR